MLEAVCEHTSWEVRYWGSRCWSLCDGLSIRTISHSRAVKKIAHQADGNENCHCLLGARRDQASESQTERRNIEVICCLKGGKSDPGTIGKFGWRAGQNDKLHAKE